MRIKQIQLIKYKRFQDLTINLGERPERIIALVGPNGCGKSSVFDAMLFLQNSYAGIGTESYKDYKYHSLDHDPGYNHRNISLTFENGEFHSNKDVDNRILRIYCYICNSKITRHQILTIAQHKRGIHQTPKD